MIRRHPALYPKDQVTALVRVGMTKPVRASFQDPLPDHSLGGDSDSVGPSTATLAAGRVKRYSPRCASASSRIARATSRRPYATAASPSPMARV
jgi:hypothetical protein